MPITVKRSASSYRKSNPQPTDSPVGAYGAKLMAAQNAAHASSLIGSSGTGFKNHIINGDFRIWQRGTTGSTNTTSGVDSADRFHVNKSSGTGFGSRVTITNAEKSVPNNSGYAYKLTCTIGNNNMGVHQKVENIRPFLGKYLTLSFWAKGTNPGGGHFKSSWIRSYDNGTNNGEWTVADNIVLNEDWQFYSFTTKIPNKIHSETIDDDKSHLWCDILRQPGDDTSTNPWEIYLANVQLEYGTQPTEFEFRPKGVELALCQRFYWKIASNTYRRINGYKRGDSNSHFEIHCPVPMRIAPAPTLLASGTFTDFQSNFNTTQSSPTINEWNTDTGMGLLVISSNWSSTHVAVRSWEGYSMEFDSEF